MLAVQISAAHGAVVREFHPISSVIFAVISVTVLAPIYYLFSPSIYRSYKSKTKPSSIKPEKVRRILGANIQQFADVPAAELDSLLSTAYINTSYDWICSWQQSIVLAIIIASNSVFTDYMQSKTWPYLLYFGLWAISACIVGIVLCAFTKPSYRRLLLQEVRRLRTESTVSA